MKYNKVILLLITLLASLIGFITIAPSTVDRHDTEGFSSFEAIKHLQVITEEKHSVYDYEAHERVRNYILDVATTYVGSENVEERNYLTVNNQNPTEGITYIRTVPVEECAEKYDIRNIFAAIPGKNETGILLVAHYDSRGNTVRNGELAASYGAADDGYGVVTLLEIMRYFSILPEQENSIYFLFMDAEEVGMDGSYQETRYNTELMNKVNFVINVEARGVEGATYMFEASLNNSEVIKMYLNASDKVTYSIAPAVYSVMTNYTDFTNFLEIGKQGLNFSTLDSIETYHVPSDNYANVNQPSIQHYGEQILPIVIEYVSDSKYQDMNYFDSNHDSVFFNFLPGVFIEYSEVAGIIFASLVLVALIAYLVLITIRKQISWKSVAIQAIYFFAFLVGSVILGYIYSAVIARLEGYKWSLTDVRSTYFKPLFLLFVLVLGYIINKLFNKTTATEESKKSFMIVANIFISLLGLIVSIALSGASFVFLLPSLFGVGYLFIQYFVHNKLALRITSYLMLFILVLVFVPLVYSLLLALSIGGTLALALIGYLPFSVVLPSLKLND